MSIPPKDRIHYTRGGGESAKKNQKNPAIVGHLIAVCAVKISTMLKKIVKRKTHG